MFKAIIVLFTVFLVVYGQLEVGIWMMNPFSSHALNQPRPRYTPRPVSNREQPSDGYMDDTPYLREGSQVPQVQADEPADGSIDNTIQIQVDVRVGPLHGSSSGGDAQATTNDVAQQ